MMINPNKNTESKPINKENNKKSTEAAPDRTLNERSTFNFSAAQMAETGYPYPLPYSPHGDSYTRMYHLQPNMFAGTPPIWLYYPNAAILPDVNRSTTDCDKIPTSSLYATEAQAEVKPPSSRCVKENKMTQIPLTSVSQGMIYIDRVRDTDVLCGRGGRSNHHTGNKMFRKVVEDMKVTYKGAGEKRTRTNLSRAIVQHVCSYGGRFIKQDGSTGKYFLVTTAEARRKTSQALRETKK